MIGIPEHVRWLFWDVDTDGLDADRDERYVLPRVLEFGGMAEVRWAVRSYGLDRIHGFLRDVGHPEMGDRTIAFWRKVLDAEGERWASPPDWRRSRSAPWPC